MKLSSLRSVIESLNRAGVRYLVAGGMAVVAHGYGRVTFDLDLVIKLERDNILNAFAALDKLGYRPRVPVRAQDFADESVRRQWIRDKGMAVLTLYSEEHSRTPIDIFAEEPFEFDPTYEASVKEEIAPGVPFCFVDIPALIQMKQKTGRDKDRDDVAHLKMILKQMAERGA